VTAILGVGCGLLDMPVVPAWIVRRNVGDPAKFRTCWCGNGENYGSRAATTLCRVGYERNDYVELKRAHGTITKLRVIWQMLPRNVGRALSLLCPHCETPRRHV